MTVLVFLPVFMLFTFMGVVALLFGGTKLEATTAEASKEISYAEYQTAA